MSAVPLLLTLARGAANGLGKHPSPDAALPPLRLTARAVRIDPARAAAYADVCGFRQPAGPGDRLPVTYPHVLGFPLAARIMAARAFPLPLVGLVHTSLDIEADDVPRVSDRPDLTVHAEALRAHRRGTEVAVVTEAAVGGETVWVSRSTYLARHATPADAGAAGPPPAGPPTAGSPAAADAPVALPFAAAWRVPAGLGRRHARVTGDWNPIHLWPATARPFGFRRPIAHGMWTAARCVAAAGPDVRRVHAVFRSPVPLPSTVHLHAALPDFALLSPEGGLHLHGTASP